MDKTVAEGRAGKEYPQRPSFFGFVPNVIQPSSPNRTSLHLVNFHLSRIPLHKLNKSIAFPWRNLTISDLPETLEERAELIFPNISGKSADKNSGAVRIGKVIHWLRGTVITLRGAPIEYIRTGPGAQGMKIPPTTLVFLGVAVEIRMGITTVDALHLSQSRSLIHPIREPNKPVTTRHPTNGIRHNLCRFSRQE